MLTRVYRPEAPVSLEDRSLQSGLSQPVVLLHRQLNMILDHMRNGFVLFTRYHDLGQVHSEIEDVVVNIPFGRQDGLDVSIDRIVDNMAVELHAHVPGAIQSASHAVLVATIAEVKVRVQAGDVVVR
jgi:hypothetical protein